MPLRIVNKQRTYPVTVCDTTFHIISMTISEKEELTQRLAGLETDDKASFSTLLDIICPAIIDINGFEGKSSREVLESLEDVRQMRDIVLALVEHCNLTKEEAKNLSSSSEQVTPESAGNAEQNVLPEIEVVSSTLMKMDE